MYSSQGHEYQGQGQGLDRQEDGQGHKATNQTELMLVSKYSFGLYDIKTNCYLT